MPAGGGAVDGEHLAMGESFAAATGSIGSQRAGVHVHGAAGQDAERDRAALEEAGGSRDRPVAASCHQHVDVERCAAATSLRAIGGPPAISIETS